MEAGQPLLIQCAALGYQALLHMGSLMKTSVERDIRPHVQQQQ